MKQLSLFESDAVLTHNKVHWKLFIDGAARNNPGPAGAGIYIVKDGESFLREGFFLGPKTNNQAEYFALLIGLFFLMKYRKQGEMVHVVSDSQLLVRQLKGEYKVKNDELKPLYSLAKKWIDSLSGHVTHVMRIENQEADAMANKGIDTKKQLPQDFIAILKEYEIKI